MARENTAAYNATEANKQKRVRVVVEQYFGRLYKLWYLFSGVYRQSHSEANEDFELACYMENRRSFDGIESI